MASEPPGRWGSGPPSTPPAPPPGSAAPPGWTSTPRQPRQAQGWLLLAVLAGVAVLVGLLGGSIAGRATVKAHGPSAAPGFADGFPNVSQSYLRGVTLAAISQQWLQRGHSFTCEANPSHRAESGRAKHKLSCSAPGNLDLDVYVDISYDDESHVSGVQAYCRLGPGKPYCRSMFADFGHQLLRGQPDLQKRAEDWARQNVDNDSSTVIGAVRLATSLDPPSISAVPAT
ncbi:MAG TPA: hypothetical protein VFA92_07185 [Candidatus Binatia bacterium]|nr:hypothetical protein [Candidatus Binatia bacterium]